MTSSQVELLCTARLIENFIVVIMLVAVVVWIADVVVARMTKRM